MLESNANSQRRHERVKLHVPITLVQDAGRTISTLMNISPYGAGVRIDKPIPEMSMVMLQFALRPPGGPEVMIQCQAAVVRCQKHGDAYEVGLYFSNTSEETRRDLESFVAKMSADRAGVPA